MFPRLLCRPDTRVLTENLAPLMKLSAVPPTALRHMPEENSNTFGAVAIMAVAAVAIEITPHGKG